VKILLVSWFVNTVDSGDDKEEEVNGGERRRGVAGDMREMTPSRAKPISQDLSSNEGSLQILATMSNTPTTTWTEVVV
jgi:hypothetical protein